MKLSHKTNDLGRAINKVLEAAGHRVSMDTILRIMALIQSSQTKVDDIPEVQNLKAWKDSAMAVEREWDAQTVGNLLGIGWGQSIRQNIEPKIRELLKDQWHPASEPPKPDDFEPTGKVTILDNVVNHSKDVTEVSIKQWNFTHWRRISPPK